MQRLAHVPGICKLHDYGINRQGIYLVMTQYSCSLRAWLAKQKVKPSQRLRLYMQIFCQLAELLKVLAFPLMQKCTTFVSRVDSLQNMFALTQCHTDSDSSASAIRWQNVTDAHSVPHCTKCLCTKVSSSTPPTATPTLHPALLLGTEAPVMALNSIAFPSLSSPTLLFKVLDVQKQLAMTGGGSTRGGAL